MDQTYSNNVIHNITKYYLLVEGKETFEFNQKIRYLIKRYLLRINKNRYEQILDPVSNILFKKVKDVISTYHKNINISNIRSKETQHIIFDIIDTVYEKNRKNIEKKLNIDLGDKW